jgi:5-methylcytosine-specific restriction endonuclease McrA
MADFPKATASWRNESKSSAERGYTWAWQKARKQFLGEHPLCVMCRKEGRVTAALVVDHVIPHRGDQELFWDRANWQALCKPHHDSDKQMWEKSRSERTKFTPDGKVVW